VKDPNKQCPFCCAENPYKLQGKTKRSSGLWKCSNSKCGKQFSVFSGTPFGRSPLFRCRVPIEKVYDFWDVIEKEPNITAHKLAKRFEVTYVTAWRLRKRILECDFGNYDLKQAKEYYAAAKNV
jgi:transposase-like protein